MKGEHMKNQSKAKKEDKIEPEVQEQAETAVSDENIEILEDEGKPDNQIKELTDKYLRTLAEYDNFRKRTAKEKASMYNDGVSDTVEKLLPVIDNFERAVASATEPNDAFCKGVVMILKQMQNTLNELGVAEIGIIGEKFDTNIHFAVAHIEDENYEESVVVELMQKGYKYKDKVIRPAMVKVAN